MTWALAGSLMFILAYGYYTVASRFPLPASEAIVFLIEFGAVVATLTLFAVVVGICLVPTAGNPGAGGGDRPPAERDD